MSIVQEFKNFITKGKVIDLAVAFVMDQEILDAKAAVGKSGMFGCEPASATSVAGVKKLVEKGVIKSSDIVVAVLTGSQLKDPDAIVGLKV